MKRILTVFAAILCLAGCKAENPRVMARFVPERHDDFIFENNLIAGRLYGKDLESCGKGQLTSPGVDIWVKIPGALVANDRYHNELVNHKSYHKDWGNGKDCYKVGRGLGAGASAPVVDGQICLPATNFRSWKILKNRPGKVVFVLSYPEWTLPDGVRVSLDKKFTIVPDTYFVKCEDCYRFEGASRLTVAAGINRHVSQNILVEEKFGPDFYALWEQASDQSVEPEDGLIGVAVVMPGAESAALIADGNHAGCTKTVKSGETLTYYFGSCWSKGFIKDPDSWFREVESVSK